MIPCPHHIEGGGFAMMGRLKGDQSQLFYEFHLDAGVPADHLVREIDAVLDLSWVHAELAPHYPSIGRRSIDPALMIRMLIVGYVFAIRSERALCREVKVNLAYRWSASSASRTRSRTTARLNGQATLESFRHPKVRTVGGASLVGIEQIELPIPSKDCKGLTTGIEAHLPSNSIAEFTMH